MRNLVATTMIGYIPIAVHADWSSVSNRSVFRSWLKRRCRNPVRQQMTHGQRHQKLYSKIALPQGIGQQMRRPHP